MPKPLSVRQDDCLRMLQLEHHALTAKGLVKKNGDVFKNITVQTLESLVTRGLVRCDTPQGRNTRYQITPAGYAEIKPGKKTKKRSN